MLFNEPKLLKSTRRRLARRGGVCFSALQRAEIAEILSKGNARTVFFGFSALQRAEIAEIDTQPRSRASRGRVSVLFNEPKLLKCSYTTTPRAGCQVSVLFNEPKLLKFKNASSGLGRSEGFSALQRAEIAEM